MEMRPRHSIPQVRRTLTLLASLVVLALVGAGAAGAAHKGLDAQGKQLVTITIPNYSYGATDVPWIVAQRMGYFAKNGLNVNSVQFGAAPDATAALYGGSLNFVLSNGGNQVIANQHVDSIDNRLVQIFMTQPYSTAVLFASPSIVASTSLKANLRALKGKTIGVPSLGSDLYRQLVILLKWAGLNPQTDVTIVSIGLAPASVAEYSGGQVQAMWTIQPVDQLMQAAGAKILFNLLDPKYTKQIPGFSPWPYGVYLTTKKWADANPQIVKQFRSALTQAAAFMSNHKNNAKVAQMWSTYNTAVPASTLKTVYAEIQPSFADGRWKPDTVSCEAMGNTVRVLLQYGLVQRSALQACKSYIWVAPK